MYIYKQQDILINLVIHNVCENVNKHYIVSYYKSLAYLIAIIDIIIFDQVKRHV